MKFNGVAPKTFTLYEKGVPKWSVSFPTNQPVDVPEDRKRWLLRDPLYEEVP